MTIRRIRGVRTRRSVGDPLPQKRAGRLVMRFFSSCALFVAVLASLMAGGSLALSGAAPASASPAGITVNCPADNLADAIYSAPAGSTLLVSGTCTGNFYIDKSLTLSGPATLDGGGVPTQYGSTLNVAAGTVVLNSLVIQDGVGINNIGGGVWNSGALTLNHSAVTHNTAGVASGVFNQGQLTLNSSTVSNNTSTSTYGSGGIFNCGGNAGFESFGLCTGSTSLTLNNSTVSNNVGGAAGDGGGIDNDLQGTLKLNGSTVSGNATGGSGGGIQNNGTATLISSKVSGNAASDGNGGGIENNGTATLISSTVSGDTAGTFNNGGGIDNEGTATLIASAVSGNTSGNTGGGIQNGGTATLNFSTVSGNTGGSGGGIQNNGTATLNVTLVANNSSTAGGQFFGNGGGVSSGPSNTDLTTLNYSIIRANSAVFVGGGIFAGGGPMKINHSVVTGNSAGTTAGGMLVWNGPTMVVNSAFSSNSDPGLLLPDTLPGVLVAPANYLGPGSNNPSFTTMHSTYS